MTYFNSIWLFRKEWQWRHLLFCSQYSNWAYIEQGISLLNKCTWIITCFWINAEGRNRAVFMHKTICDFSIGSFISIICMDLQHKCSRWLIFQNWRLLFILHTLWEEKQKNKRKMYTIIKILIRLFTLVLRSVLGDQITSGQLRYNIVYIYYNI